MAVVYELIGPWNNICSPSGFTLLYRCQLISHFPGNRQGLSSLISHFVVQTTLFFFKIVRPIRSVSIAKWEVYSLCSSPVRWPLFLSSRHLVIASNIIFLHEPWRRLFLLTWTKSCAHWILWKLLEHFQGITSNHVDKLPRWCYSFKHSVREFKLWPQFASSTFSTHAFPSKMVRPF